MNQRAINLGICWSTAEADNGGERINRVRSWARYNNFSQLTILSYIQPEPLCNYRYYIRSLGDINGSNIIIDQERADQCAITWEWKKKGEKFTPILIKFKSLIFFLFSSRFEYCVRDFFLKGGGEGRGARKLVCHGGWFRVIMVSRIWKGAPIHSD